jgi:FAD/FMN-containing dehydrogenase
MIQAEAGVIPAELLDELRQELGADAVLTGDDVHERSAGIWRKDTIAAGAIVRPRSTEQVALVLKACHAAGQPVVTHGGLTGLVKGALTAPNELVLSMERMNRIEAIHPVDRTAVVQAGVLLQHLQEAADAEGLLYPLDLGARGSCTVGGNIATNAGGNRVIRYGMTRDMVLGLEAVLADGTIVSSMNQMIKNNAGYDLKQLFIGTEGSLGIVTRAVLRLREKPGNQATLFAALESFDDLGRFLKHMDAALSGTLSAFEVMWQNFYTLVTTPPAQGQPPLPQTYPYYVLVEALGATDAVVEAALASALEEGLIADAVLAQSEAQRLGLWALRDDVEQCFQYAPTFTFDVSLRITHMQSYVDEVNARLAASYEAPRNFTFGHMGDGNLHFVVAVGEGGPAHRAAVERCVYEPLAAIGGSVSAEHGVGLEKKPWLGISRSAEELALMGTLKRALDPQGLLNPGKIFDVIA